MLKGLARARPFYVNMKEIVVIHLVIFMYMIFCRSFFPETQKDYTKNKALWTLLYKKKVNFGTGLESVLYDRLK